jgi:hypothetical protein
MSCAGGRISLPFKGAMPGLIARLRGELVASQAFASPADAQRAFDMWMQRYNASRRGAPGA